MDLSRSRRLRAVCSVWPTDRRARSAGEGLPDCRPRWEARCCRSPGAVPESAEADAALAERVRARIVQGAGRCTRGPNDYAVVVVFGSDIMKYFSRPENLKGLEPELQAEVRVGWQNSKGVEPAEVIQNVEMFLEHGADWREQGEPAVSRVPPTRGQGSDARY